MASRSSISWRAQAVKALLRVTRRRRIYSSVAGLMAGIEATRRAGPARPPSALLRTVNVEAERVGACEVYTLRPRSQSSGQVVLYLHGGAYCRPITPQHWSFLRWLVADEGCTVVVPLYPLAPENQCLETVGAVREVHEKLIERHKRVDAFVGDSAGAGLCLALCQDLGEAGRPLPGRIVLITPWVDATLTHASIAGTERRDPMLAIHGIREAGRLYAGSLGAEHPWVSPLRADLRGLPPMQVLAGTDDILHHDAMAFADKARAAGCAIELHLADGMVHAWPLLPVPEARLARQAIGKFLKEPAASTQLPSRAHPSGG
ncbi:MAG TPA: alpha/beta hydrolase [Candidatus Margulisiibacteriota bacterium]|nr:alpha/beta hydrolase [Candidatus Margulisiibacteriota bacterium]